MDQKLWGKNCNLGHFGGISDPFDPRGSKINFSPGSRVLNICVYQCCLTFWRVSEKLNGWIKSYGAKITILVILGVFFTPLTPRGSKIRFFSGSRVLNICLYQHWLAFWRVSEKFNGWIKSYGAKIVILVILGVFLTPLTPVAQKSDFSKDLEHSTHAYINLISLFGKFQKNSMDG